MRGTCIVSCFLTAVLLLLFMTVSVYGGDEVKIGVLASRSAEDTLKTWQPTAEYLSKEITPYSFVIVPLDLNAIAPAVEHREVDFIITNPSNYVGLETSYGATRIATMKSIYGGRSYKVFASVIFRRADREDIRDLNSLKGKSFMAVQENIFAWEMAWQELKDNGVDPYRDFKELKFSGLPQDLVVYAVRDGKADAGAVRTGILDNMISEGRINLTDFVVINQHQDEFSLLHSTRNYPEWAFAKAKHVPDELAEKVSVALLGMPADSAAVKAANASWTVPLDYQPVHELMKELRIGPYADYGKITVIDVIKNYWHWILIVIAALLFERAAELGRTNKKLRQESAERKQAEEVLKESEWQLREYGRIAKIGGWEFDPVTLKGTWTDEVARIHDLDPGEETNVEIGLRFYNDESRKKIEAAIKEAIESGKPYNLELELVTAKGVRKWVKTIGEPVREGEKIVKVRGSFQDVTELKRTEEELRKHRDHLDELVKERTTELNAKKEELQENQTALLNLVEELNGATARLEATNKELQAFSYSVSHDLRAPLRAIEGFSQALLEDYKDKLDEQGKDYLNRVSASTKRMAELIDAMLSLSRLTRGEIKPVTVDMSALAKTIAEELQKTQPDRKAEFVIAKGVTARGDAQMLRIVLENLLSNAWKFTGKHPAARIEFGVTQVEGKAAYFVKDDGAGFDKAYADKLFSAFQRLHTEAEFPGIGIGLATVQRIIHRHGGRVWAQGEVEKGATFYFTI